MSETTVEPVVVTIDDQHVSQIESLAIALRTAGLQITKVLPSIGIITGMIEQSKRQSLKSVAGVAAVETDGEAHML